MESGPIFMENTRGKMETVADFIFLGSKITGDSDCSHKIKRRLLLGRKAMTNLDSILKSGDIILPTKVCIVKTMVLPVVMYGCESWTIKKAELQITADGNSTHEIKRYLLIGRKSMTNLDSVLKSRDITLPTKVCVVVKAMVFPIVMFGCESWTIKKAEY